MKGDKEVIRIDLKSLLSIVDSSVFALAHLFLIIVMNIRKSSVLEYLEFFKSCSIVNLAISVATLYLSI